ncbi:exodeoxyribonuclease V subunit alpha [Comamonas humi]
MMLQMSTAELLQVLEQWVEQGWLRPLDRAFAQFLHRLSPESGAPVLLAAALASHQLGRGHVCMDLAAALADSRFVLSLPPDGAQQAGVPLPAELLQNCTPGQWQQALIASDLIASMPDAAASTPLVLQGTRLYLRRYWQYEQSVGDTIAARVAHSARPPAAALRQSLDVLFPPAASPAGPDWQKLACALAASSGFAIITGGPGTGKTTTVVKLLALLQATALHGQGRPLRIALAAPTGKAAARLTESISGALDKLGDAQLPPVPAGAEPLKSLIPSQAQTLHRLLGSRPDSRHFRHHARQPLAWDVVVVDEASMVDLEMMAALLDAMPPQARLVLLGDKDQLASVEAGAVLGELCRHADQGLYWPETVQWLQAATGEQVPPGMQDLMGQPLDQAVAMLRHSHRFDGASGIGQLATAVNAGDVRRMRQVLRHGYGDLAAYALADAADPALAELVVHGGRKRFAAANADGPHGYAHYLGLLATMPQHGEQQAFDDWARQLLQAHGRFQLLCALRSGPWGVQGLNNRIAQILHRHQLIAQTSGWYAGRPVLVTRNDYGLGLMNGDIGITVAMPNGSLRVVFATSEGVRWVLPSRLQAVETVYAMTVHKSQGSEFTHAALVLPPTLSPILTRELVYTGLTRARQWLTLAAGGQGFRTLDAAVQRRVERASGLRGRH